MRLSSVVSIANKVVTLRRYNAISLNDINNIIQAMECSLKSNDKVITERIDGHIRKTLSDLGKRIPITSILEEVVSTNSINAEDAMNAIVSIKVQLANAKKKEEEEERQQALAELERQQALMAELAKTKEEKNNAKKS